MKNRNVVIGKPFFITFMIAVVVSGTLMITILTRSSATTTNSILCTFAGSLASTADTTTPIQLLSILHYATSPVVPQQSRSEIQITLDVLKTLSPCNFLVFGLGHDSLMWSSLNPRGTTLFIEEDIRWVQRVLKDAPSLHVHPVHYETQLSDADHLLSSYRSDPRCLPLTCSSAAPGRMAVIFSAAVMARARMRPGVTHVFLHDVNRRVEKAFAHEFLCEKNRVESVGRLWHFEIPPAAKVSGGGQSFC
ncbi:putative methyltransferase [Camellia lanceoleosa]|uniref:Methyltransferase n=1 Tax=Camellia lanceoleosa TaxID=1840588 RepID=A0ACC0IZ63_9ERIC|nr:putative methyltransferase [Camellia lanceoleosa]